MAVQRYKAMFDKEGREQEGNEGNATDKEKEERISAAREIYERHISLSAAEPVNVDSHARHFVEENISRADSKIFVKVSSRLTKKIINLSCSRVPSVFFSQVFNILLTINGR